MPYLESKLHLAPPLENAVRASLFYVCVCLDGSAFARTMERSGVTMWLEGDGMQGVCECVQEEVYESSAGRRLTLHAVLQASRSSVTCGMLLGDPRATQMSLSPVQYHTHSIAYWYSLL